MIIENYVLDSNDNPSFDDEDTLNKIILAPIYLRVNNFDNQFPTLDGESEIIIGYVNNVFVRCNQLIGDIFILDKFYNNAFSIDWIDYVGISLFRKATILTNPENLGLDRDKIAKEYYKPSISQNISVIEIEDDDFKKIEELYYDRNSLRGIISFYVDLSDTDNKKNFLKETIFEYQQKLEEKEKELYQFQDQLKYKYIPESLSSQKDTINFDIDFNNKKIRFYNNTKNHVVVIGEKD